MFCFLDVLVHSFEHVCFIYPDTGPGAGEALGNKTSKPDSCCYEVYILEGESCYKSLLYDQLFNYSCRSPITGEGNGNPLPYSCLENSMDRGAWRAAVHGATESRTLLTNTAPVEVL